MSSLLHECEMIANRAATLRQRARHDLDGMLARLQREAERSGSEQDKRQRRAILRGWRSALNLLSERPLSARMAHTEAVDTWLEFIEDNLRAELFDEVMK